MTNILSYPLAVIVGRSPTITAKEPVRGGAAALHLLLQVVFLFLCTEATCTGE